jgi:hypothetical protein
LGYVTFDVRCRSLTFDADNPIAAKLEIAAYLTATEKTVYITRNGHTRQ